MLSTLFELSDDEVHSACSGDRAAKRDAWMGDVELKHIISKMLFDEMPAATERELTRLRERYEANAVMAWFLRDGTDLSLVGQSVHALGTAFEAMMQRASSQVTRLYMSWVAARMDQPGQRRLRAARANDQTVWQWEDESGIGTVVSDLSPEEDVQDVLSMMNVRFIDGVQMRCGDREEQEALQAVLAAQRAQQAKVLEDQAWEQRATEAALATAEQHRAEILARQAENAQKEKDERKLKRRQETAKAKELGLRIGKKSCR